MSTVHIDPQRDRETPLGPSDDTHGTVEKIVCHVMPIVTNSIGYSQGDPL
jgi:hypothetical protein